jgi:hypothetical protein
LNSSTVYAAKKDIQDELTIESFAKQHVLGGATFLGSILNFDSIDERQKVEEKKATMQASFNDKVMDMGIFKKMKVKTLMKLAKSDDVSITLKVVHHTNAASNGGSIFD